jgi:fructokinase
MISGAPHEARWVRPEPRRTLPATTLDRIVHRAFAGKHVAEVQALTAGRRNANFRVRLGTGADWFVVRIYEHDPSLCQKEVDLIQLIGASVPVPDVLYAQPGGLEDLSPFVVMRYVEGITFRELKSTGTPKDIAEAAFSIGETLEGIGRFRFPKSGWLAPGPTVTKPLMEGMDATPRFVDLCLASTNLQRRMNEELRDRVHSLVWSKVASFAAVDYEASLVHGDFGKHNLMVRHDAGGWRVAAVLDWEFAVSGSPLVDLGHFLRYERVSRPFAEPHFSQGYRQAGGTLPEDWRALARVVDMTALVESLTHEHLPDEIVEELVELVGATVEGRDPVLP